MAYATKCVFGGLYVTINFYLIFTFSMVGVSLISTMFGSCLDLDLWFIYHLIKVSSQLKKNSSSKANKTFFSSFRMPSTKLWLTIDYGFLTLPFEYLEIEIVLTIPLVVIMLIAQS